MVMTGQPELTAGPKTRVLAILVLGEPLEAPCRAVTVSSTAVGKRVACDPAFAERLRAAREHGQSVGWQVAAGFLEPEHSDRRALPASPI